jgi:hypothetical protein
MKRILFIFFVVGMVVVSGVANKVFGQSGQLNGRDYVDLGLSVKWATCNIGSDTPEGFGDYFAWGETKPKRVYDSDSYIFNFQDYPDMIVLPANADVAASFWKWGNGWRMPTKEEFEELINKCTWVWMSNGYKVVGPNGNSIFLPAAGWKGISLDGEAHFYNEGFGSYWSSTRERVSDDGRGGNANYLNFSSTYYFVDLSSNYTFGHSVRPVCQ